MLRPTPQRSLLALIALSTATLSFNFRPGTASAQETDRLPPSWCSIYLYPHYRNVIDALQLDHPMMPNLNIDLNILYPFRTLPQDPKNGTELIRRTPVGAHPVRSDFAVPSSFQYQEGAQSSDHQFLYEFGLSFDPLGANQARPRITHHLYPHLSERVQELTGFDHGIERVFGFYVERETTSSDVIQGLRVAEEGFNPRRAVQALIQRKGTKEPLAYVRLMDGSPVPFLTSGSDPQFPVASAVGGQELDLEKKFPHINFRAETDEIYVIEKFGIDPELVNGSPVLLRALATYLDMKYAGNIPPKATIYSLTPQKISRIHTRSPPADYVLPYYNSFGNHGYGLRRKFDPQTLGGEAEAEKLCVLEITVQEFVDHYLKYKVTPLYRMK